MKWREAVRRFARDTSGLSAMEFSFVMVPMIIVLFGVIQFGGILFLQNDMHNAARDAARRMASVEICFGGSAVQCGSQTSGSVEDFACNFLSAWTPSFQVTATETNTADGFDMQVTIETDMAAAAIVDLLGIFEGRTMSATAILRREYEAASPPPCP